MKPESSSGYWKAGMQYKPTYGPCTGHTVEVLNPETELMLSGVIEDGPNKGKQVRTKQVGVLVRCLVCLKSWGFPESIRLDDEH